LRIVDRLYQRIYNRVGIMCAEQFTEVAPWYDDLMAEVPYQNWVRYVEKLAQLHGLSPKSVLDLACGTGRVSRILAQKGYAVVGVDGSPAMIREAQSKTNGEIPFYCQRMQELSLNQRFDLVICLFDSLNYITEPSELQAAFCRVSEHLNPEGLFIFDVNGEAAYTNNLFTQTSLGRWRKVQYVWQADYNPSTRICEVHMRFIVNENGRKREFFEVHRQRCYTVPEIQNYLQQAGLECLECLDAFTTRPATKASDRIYFVARKILAEHNQSHE